MNKISCPFVFKDGIPTYWKKALVIPVLLEYSTKETLLNSLASQLSFPDYFGDNWDALSDCLRDLSWIETKMIILWHQKIPLKNRVELRDYLEVLCDCICDWETDERHDLVVIFPSTFQFAATQLLGIVE